ncbi:MAG TPA: asparagine synthase (glutamine-hydrolyzing), partial [Chthoniobacterales bacterium]
MCGIAGICNLTRDDAPEEPLLRRMLAAIRHRGPDEFGIYLDDHTGLGSARLSILDLAGGQQPIANEDETLWIVFNGEIFNYLELRAELESAGHIFRTETDTEVLLHLYEDLGPECLRKLNGDWAVALWNSSARELFLARDRVGVRPLFYTLNNGRLVFGSEIKALLADPAVSPEVDPIALNQIFTFWSTLAPRTAFRGIQEIPPGCCATVRDGKVDVRQWWKLEFSEKAHTQKSEELADALAALLVDATKLRLRADVPVGAYLSGGLDSSTIAAVVRHETNNRLDTFSIAFTDAQFDESMHQQRMAAALGTDHHIVRAAHGDIARVFPELIRHVETPIVRTAPAP